MLVLILVIVGCREGTPTPVAFEANETAAPQPPTAVPTETATLHSTDTPVPTNTPAPTFTFTPSATPLPLLVVFVMDETGETFLPGSQVLLDDAGLAFHAEQTVTATGQATFANLTVGETYTVTVKAEGYQDTILPVEFMAGLNELQVALEPGVFVTVTGEDANLRSGPGVVYGRTESVEAGSVLQVVGQNEDGNWLLVLTADSTEAWLDAALVEMEGVDLSGVTAVAAPATPTLAPTTVAAIPISQPPPAPVIPAGNLLSNPSFESGSAGWSSFGERPAHSYTAADNPQFVHSGSHSVVIVNGKAPYYYQSLQNITPGQTYRAGVWVKVWSSSGENRTISENAGDYSTRLCINPLNETDPNKGTNVCTGYVRPLDTWQYISIDAVAVQDTMAVILQSAPIGPNLPLHNEAIFDDVSLTVSSVAATATPAPAGPPVRPAPVPFNAAALGDNMSQVEWVLNQMGGLLDRLYNGSWESCEEYEGYYRQIMTSPAYHSLPDEWLGVYNEYIFSVEHTTDRNNGVFSLCQNGGGSLNAQAYGDARSSIAESLNRLIPAVQQANALLGQ
jgi:hypothetical protein